MSATDGLHMHLRLQRFQGFELSVQLDLPGKGIHVIYGASGSGKTTLLRCIAGLEPEVQGQLRVGGQTWLDSSAGLRRATHRRALGYVFQEASLFDHLSVRQNLAYGLKRCSSPNAQERLEQAVSLLGLAGLLDRDPGTLSGGERQRVAIARALATQPQALLLDEPLTALDPGRRHEIMPWLLRLRDELRLPMVYVTHSVDELTRLGDQLIVMDQGRVHVAGPLQETFVHLQPPWLPAHEQGALWSGTVTGVDEQWHLAHLEVSGLGLWVQDEGLAMGQQVRVRLLARDISIVTQEPAQTSIQNHWPARIIDALDLAHPSQRLVRLQHPGGVLLARITHRAWFQLKLQPGQQVWAQIKSVAVVR